MEELIRFVKEVRENLMCQMLQKEISLSLTPQLPINA